MNNKLQWVDKYKPKKIDDLIISPIIKKSLKFYIEKRKIPNIILSGKSGIGKTSLATLLCRESNFNFKEYNASDNRGIEIVNDILKFYSKVGKKKIIILLDEADNITHKAQLAIYNLISYYNDITIIFTVNNSNHLLNFIQKKCLHLNFEKVLAYDKYLDFINDILKKENYSIDENYINEVIKNNNYDIRKIISILEIVSINNNLNMQHNFHKIIINFYKDIENISRNEAYIQLENIIQKEMISLIDFLFYSISYISENFQENEKKNRVT